jgi:hypothetical protein
METAIAVYKGDLTFNDQVKKVLIVSCTDPKVEGFFFCVKDQYVEIGRHYLVQFDPDDQFCRIIPLADAKELLAVP